jgi:hypothetical protein
VKEGIAMKFYIASHSGIASDGMSYKEFGGHEDLNSLFPELTKIINHQSFRTIDIRLINGDRLKIYDINKTVRLDTWDTSAKFNSQNMEEMTDEKRAFVHSRDSRNIKLQHSNGSTIN